MSSVNTTISFSFFSMHHKIQNKNPCKRWSKIFGKHENLLSRINFFSFLPKMLSTRFLPQILCVLQRETTFFREKLPQKSFIMQLKFSFTIFRVFRISIQRKWRKICFDWKGFWTHHFMRMSVVRRCAFLIIWAIPIWFLFQWLQKNGFEIFHSNCTALQRERVSLSRAYEFFLPMARVEPARCQMAPAYPMRRVDCDVSHSMNYPVKRRCSEMIVGLITKSLNSQMLTSCLMMISSFAEESSWESCWDLESLSLLQLLPLIDGDFGKAWRWDYLFKLSQFRVLNEDCQNVEIMGSQKL